jgi:tetratricopeptide (TPR) repeat protein
MHQLRWMDHLTADYENICAALSWFARQAGAGVANAPATQQVDVPQVAISQPSPLLSRADALELALRLAAAFRPYWEWRGYLREGRFWFSQLLALPLPGDATPSLLAAHARVLTEASRLMWLQNRGDDAVALAEQSLALWRRLEDNPRGHALALLQRGWPAHGSGDFLLAKQCYQEGLDLLSPVTDPWFFAMLLIHLAAAAGFLNEFQLMRACYQQGQELFTRLGDQCSCADLLKDYGALLILEGSYGESIDRLLESLRLCSTLRHKQFQATGMFWLSFAVGMCGAPDPVSAALCAAQLRGVADELMQEIGMIHWAQALELTRRAEMSIRSVVTEQAWEEALASGRTLSVTQVLDLVAAWRREYVH